MFTNPTSMLSLLKPVVLNTRYTPIKALKIINAFLRLLKIFQIVVLPYQKDAIVTSLPMKGILCA